jgi:type I restriction enzyme S subunit
MSSDWSNMPFGNFISLQRGHDLPEQERIKGDVPILGSFGVTGWHNKSLAKALGLTIGRSGASFGTATYTERDYFPLNTTLYVTDFKGNHPKFAYYFAEQFDFSPFNSGSAQPSLNRNFINPVEVRIPPLAEQKAIAHILGTLDDKIELNRKTNETLEAMAKALFKSWFVDFDPVRAKAEGRPAGLPAEISDLFPDSFEDSELGEIPSGWSISCVNDLCEWVSSGGTPSRSRKDFWENGNIPWFKTGELNDAPLLDSAEKINELALGNSSCKYWEAGTILFAIYASPTVGRLGVLTESGTSNQAAAGLKAKGGIGTPFLRRTLLFSRDELQNIAVGAAQQNINVQILKDHKVVAPGSSLATVYSKTISPLDEQQICLAKSTREFCLLRDALLPKLISGEIRIPDAEKMLEQVGI